MDDEPDELNIPPAWENAAAFEITRPDGHSFVAAEFDNPCSYADSPEPFWEFYEERHEMSTKYHQVPHAAVLAGNSSCLEYNGYTIVPLLRAYEASAVMLSNSTQE